MSTSSLAANDRGNLGIFARKERLNVLLSRQKQHLFVIGEMTCCDSDFATATAEDLEDEPSPPKESTAESSIAAALGEDENAPIKNLLNRRNTGVMKVLDWFKKHGPVQVVGMDLLKEVYVTFPETRG